MCLELWHRTVFLETRRILRFQLYELQVYSSVSSWRPDDGLCLWACCRVVDGYR